MNKKHNRGELGFLLVIIALILAALFDLSCAAPGMIRFRGSQQIKQCITPELVAVGSDIPDEMLQPIKDAIQYWNTATESKLFELVLVKSFTAYQPESNGFTTISLMSQEIAYTMPSTSCAATLYRVDTEGCMSRVKILLKPECLNSRTLEKNETSIRHELGHALGLSHSTVFTDLMYSNPPDDMSDPIDVSSSELQEVKNLYSLPR